MHTSRGEKGDEWWQLGKRNIIGHGIIHTKTIILLKYSI